MADELVTVATFEVLPPAELTCARLKAAGIPAFLADAETVYMDWALGNALGYIKLQVPRAQAEKALTLLADPEALAAETDAQGGEASTFDADHSTSDSAPSSDDLASAGEKHELLEGDGPGETLEEGDESKTIMETFRWLKKPVFFLILAPTFIGLAWLALLFLAKVLGQLFNPR